MNFENNKNVTGEKMETTLHLKGLIYLLVGVFLLNPLAAETEDNNQAQQSYQLSSAEPMLLTSRLESDKATAAISEKPGELSDGWKYAIALSVMFLFLGLALFIQIRNEREK
jgi:hypothetical protein